MERSLRAALERGTQIVTVHRRQARQIRYRYAAARQSDGAGVWESPRVAGWDDWLSDLHQDVTWSGYSAPRVQRKLLTRFQEQVLWESILHAHGGDILDDVPGAARQAATAWSLVQAYRLPDPARLPHQTAEVEAFGRWMRRYFSRCRDHSLIDHGRLADIVAPALRAGAIAPPESVLLVGFDDFAPQQRLVLKTLEDLGTKLDRYTGARVESRPVRVQLASPRDELAAAARFTRRILTDSPSDNTVILVPDLVAQRRAIVRVFDDALMPGSSLPSANQAGRPYNLAVGEPLHVLPIVRVALAVTRLATGALGIDDLGELLRTPFLRGGQTEAPLRARFDAWLRQHHVVRVRVAELPALFERFRTSRPHVPEASATGGLLAALPALTDAPDTPQRASQWCTRWRELLSAVGWPGDDSLDSAFYQTTERFRSLIDEIAGLDFLTGSLTAPRAVRRLTDLCESIKFQPQTPDLSVQIMLPDQAMGLQFDHVWWCGVYAGAFPAPAAPNPFLPRAWQHDHRMPGSSAAVELQRAQRLATRILRSARNVVVSAPKRVDDHPVSMAPLIDAVESATLASLNLADAPVAARPVVLESVADFAGPSVEVGEGGLSGGTSLLALQATCPFRAFGELRLRAGDVEVPRAGLDPRARGQLLHAMLERLWRRLQSFEMLKRLDLSGEAGDEYVQLQLFELAESVLDEHDAQRLQPLSPRFRGLERQRLITRTLAWLRVEAAREPFIVSGTEEPGTVALAGLPVNVTIDRIDHMADGGSAVVDYKTGQAELSDWFGDRPTQPQLPLYALAQPGDVDMIAFGLVHPADPRFLGIGRNGDEAPGIRPLTKVRAARDEHLQWDDLKPYWRKRLARLAEHFAAGDARVDPKDANACRYCSLPSLCRIDSVGRREPTDDDAAQTPGVDGD